MLQRSPRRGSVPESFAEAVDRCDATKAVVGPFPVVEVLPLGELVLQGWISKVDSWPELLKRRFLDPLNLAVEMR